MLRGSFKKSLSDMSSEIKGYQVDACFSGGGCPNAIFSGSLQEKIEALLKKENLLGFLKSRVKGDIRFHHEFKIAISDCPNACSQPCGSKMRPQIAPAAMFVPLMSPLRP